MTSYIVRHHFSVGAAAVVVVSLCVGWPLYNGVAQVDAADDDANLTVGQCIEANGSVAPFEEVLIKEDIIEEDLLQTKVTNGMCKDMLEPIPDGTPPQKLAAAQNYIQEINLIEEAMRQATGKAAARATDSYPSSDESLIQFRAMGHTSEQVAAQAQYPDPIPPNPDPIPPNPDPIPPNPDPIPPIPPREWQAAAAASAGEDNDASVAERMRQKEAALRDAGASVSEARAGARCGTEVEVSDEDIEKAAKKSEKGLYEIIPQMPKEIRRGDSEQAGLLVSPLTKEKFQQITQTHRAIGEVSKSTIGCVVLTDRMKAVLLTPDLDALKVDRIHHDDIQELSSHQDTHWSWDINGRQVGNPKLWLDLSYEISPEDQEFRLIKGSPVYEKPVRVSSPPPPPPPPPWWQRIFERISGLFGG